MLLLVVLAQTEIPPLVYGVPAAATLGTAILVLTIVGRRVVAGQGARIEALERIVGAQEHRLNWMSYKLDWLTPKAIHNGVTIPSLFYRQPNVGEDFPDLDA